ncbi:translation initiation factor eIF4e [Delitschia confertaspora ATCC 74209]|uniref:Translation initiation factor eIF4e n=1 Tax=Delitschia confertaspora ATCC 74209 TaxID=1513339 RepID=A0A9P4JT56_9PLEO|nr:translation initiation factor eIF4e [Delitschia confertaspora ATCC 74209]
MAFPRLATSNLPTATSEETKNTMSPARGAPMKNQILQKLRAPEFVHAWQFWFEKGQSTASAVKAESADDYASHVKPLGDDDGKIRTIRDYFQITNNFSLSENLKARGDSVHMFHLGVKPLWEDPRNARGGAYYFRVSKDRAEQFWEQVCLMAVGDVLQAAVATNRNSFNDEITGVTYSIRWNAVQIAIWNRDADNEAGIQRLLETVLEELSEEVKPRRKEEYWYKAHKAHKGFVGAVGN